MPLAKGLPCGDLCHNIVKECLYLTWYRSWRAGPRSRDRPVEGRGIAFFLNADVDKVGTSGKDQSVRIFVRSRTIPRDGQSLGDRHGDEQGLIDQSQSWPSMFSIRSAVIASGQRILPAALVRRRIHKANKISNSDLLRFPPCTTQRVGIANLSYFNYYLGLFAGIAPRISTAV
jgi:hypothetical protein